MTAPLFVADEAIVNTLADMTRLLAGEAPEDVFLAGPEVVIKYDDVKHRYWIDGDETPSVTKVLDKTMPKPALTWWGFRVGMSVIVRALADNKITTGELLSMGAWEPVVKPADFPDHPDVLPHPKNTGKFRSRMEQLAMDLRHHPNAIKEDKGTIGTSIHVAAEQSLISGELPTYGDFPEADRGYVQAFARWFVDTEPEPEEQEVIVGSKRHGFAGRFDLERRRRADHGLIRSDFKTSGGIYADYHLQLTLYDIASLVMGREPCVGAELIHLRPDGTYYVQSVALDYTRALCKLVDMRLAELHESAIKALGGEV